MRALIVDDSRAMRTILSKTVRALGMETIEAANGKLALEQLGLGPFDFVLTDWHMPEMDGFEFLCAARKDARFQQLPIIMVTSEAEASIVEQALAAGATEFLMKPFSAESIVMKLEMLGLVDGVSQ